MKALLLTFVVSLAAGAQPRIILVGDSTMAVKSGYGPGFCAIVRSDAICLNMAKGGRSTSSYRAEGSWDQVMEKLKTGASDTWVLIQFGHNDQPGKPGRSTDLATEFPDNLRRYVEEVKSAGAHPVLVTPLTRRSFRNGQLQDTLGPWADAAKKVAAELGAPLLDLHAESMAAVQKMGAVEASTLAMAPPPAVVIEGAAAGNSPNVLKPETADPNAPVFDYTHLGAKGSAFFGRMVASELAEAVPALQPYLPL
jgi:lysophospholipase L1-like esterase